MKAYFTGVKNGFTATKTCKSVHQAKMWATRIGTYDAGTILIEVDGETHRRQLIERGRTFSWGAWERVA
jgi:hypothetical protein